MLSGKKTLYGTHYKGAYDPSTSRAGKFRDFILPKYKFGTDVTPDLAVTLSNYVKCERVS